MSLYAMNHKVKTYFRSEENLYVSSKIHEKERSEIIMCSNRRSKHGMQYLEIPSKSTSCINQERSPKWKKKLFEHAETYKHNKNKAFLQVPSKSTSYLNQERSPRGSKKLFEHFDNKNNHKPKNICFVNNNVHTDQKNVHKLKNIGINMKDFVLLTYNRVRKDSLKSSHKNNHDTDDLNIFGIEEIIDTRPYNAYLGRRGAREVIRYKRLASIEEGDESVFDRNLGLHHFYREFEEHQNCKAELEIILLQINKIKEKMIPNSHPEGLISVHSLLQPKRSPRRFHYERKGFLEIRTKLT